MSTEKTMFDDYYATHTAPWVLGEAQPEIVEQERAGRIAGTVLDIGCGLGDNTLFLTERGYDVLGADFSEEAIRQARQNAANRDVPARFEVGDALRLDRAESFDTVVDSAVFHCFDEQDQQHYTRNLHRMCRPGAVVHLLVGATPDDSEGDIPPGPPRVSEQTIRQAFGEGWQVEELRAAELSGTARGEVPENLNVAPGARVTTSAWFARMRRV